MTIWEDPRVDYLRELHAEGLYAKDIAYRLSERYEVTFTRNAVLGKCHRLGLPGEHGGPRPNSGRKPAKPRQTPLRPPATDTAPPAPSAPPPAAEPAGAHRCELLELTNEMCRYPITDEGPPHIFCGNPGADLAKGIVYCPIHMRMAYRRPGQPA